MSRSIYVAGGSDERAECQVAIDRLEAGGWLVTHHWPKDAGYPENGGAPDPLRSAETDYNAVTSADYFWLRTPEQKSEGAFFEFGIATCARDIVNASREVARLSLPRATIVSGPWARSIFARLASIRFDTHEQALAWLLEMAP